MHLHTDVNVTDYATEYFSYSYPNNVNVETHLFGIQHISTSTDEQKDVLIPYRYFYFIKYILLMQGKAAFT